MGPRFLRDVLSPRRAPRSPDYRMESSALFGGLAMIPYEFRRTSIAILGVLALLVSSCGGGGGSPYQADGTNPVISNLVVSPTSFLHNQGGGSANIDVSVEFSDREGDVNYMGTNILDSSGGLLYVSGAPLPQLLGQTAGMAQAMIRINTDTAGTFTLRVWLVDETIRSSNRLEMQFTVS